MRRSNGNLTRTLGILALVMALAVGGCRPAARFSGDTASWVEADAHFNRLFTRANGGWTGGDGTLSVPLPDGRSAWFFGDTLLGRVDPDGRRAPDTPFIRNSLVVQDGDRLTTLHGGSEGRPSDFFPPPGEGQWYWPGHGVATGKRLQVFLHRFRARAPELWAWEWVGTDLATLSLPDLRLEGIRPTAAANGVLYGVCLLADAGYTYIFGTRDAAHPKEAHLARTAAGSLEGPWEYFDGGRWTRRPEDSAPILAGVSTQFAVSRVGRRCLLITMDGREPFSNALLLFQAPAPQGPWRDPRPLLRAPEAGGDVVAYNPFVHPQFTVAGRLLVSYNLNHISDPTALYRDAALYRPRFVRLDLERLEPPAQ